MAMVVEDLAKALFDAFSDTNDRTGNQAPLTSQAKAYARGVIAAITAGKAMQPSVTGITKQASSLKNGASQGGKLLNIVNGPMTGAIMGAFPESNAGEMVKEHKAVCEYIVANAKVSFEPGTINGQCTSTAVSDGPLVAGKGRGGKISGLVGSALAAKVKGVFGAFPKIPEETDMIPFYTALCDYIMENAEVSYASGMVVGTCPPSAGPLSGSASNGKIK